MDDRGIVVSAVLDDESLVGVDPAIPSLMTQFTENRKTAAPLPAEPVGIGARWTVEQFIAANGLEVSQSVEYRLVAIEGTVITLEVRISQQPATTTIQLPGVPGDVTVAERTTVGTGSTALDLANPVPTSSVEMRSRQVLVLSQGESEQLITARIDISPAPFD
jgi:hypothetical protein